MKEQRSVRSILIRYLVIFLVVFISFTTITFVYNRKQIKNRTEIEDKDVSILVFEQAVSLGSYTTEIFEFKLTEALKVEQDDKTLYCYRLLIAPEYESNISIEKLSVGFDEHIGALFNSFSDGSDLQALAGTMNFRYEGTMKAWYVYMVAGIQHDAISENNLTIQEVEQYMKILNVQIAVNHYFKDSFTLQFNGDFEPVPYKEGIDADQVGLLGE
ncbi:MAG: hypothetical protein IJM15_07525 [Erysipelotrichaceae bacterium]|nr:hypothetical protein [Erysipelotrichaceae bacterium]